MDMKQAILDYVVSVGGGVTFVELCRSIEGFAGDLDVGILDKNIVFWSGVSNAGMDAIIQLSEEGKLKITPTSTLCYFIDGGALNLPIVKQGRSYKKPHWLPVVFNLSHQDGAFLGGLKKG
jgi:hypothetical protein